MSDLENEHSIESRVAKAFDKVKNKSHKKIDAHAEVAKAQIAKRIDGAYGTLRGDIPAGIADAGAEFAAENSAIVKEMAYEVIDEGGDVANDKLGKLTKHCIDNPLNVSLGKHSEKVVDRDIANQFDVGGEVSR